VGVLTREKVEIGVFLCFEEPTKPMKKEAAEAGLYKSTDGSTYSRLQILIIQQILDGKQPEYPAHRATPPSKNSRAPSPLPPKTSHCRSATGWNARRRRSLCRLHRSATTTTGRVALRETAPVYFFSVNKSAGDCSTWNSRAKRVIRAADVPRGTYRFFGPDLGDVSNRNREY
jgi:hypothetical protein